MDAGTSSIVVATIGTVSAVLVAVIQKFRKENKKDHSLVYETLLVFRDEFKDNITEVKTDVKNVHNKLDNHINWHLNKKD